ncbi:MAG: hypothetical protein AB1458_01865 [Bacteroidota bacterium]
MKNDIPDLIAIALAGGAVLLFARFYNALNRNFESASKKGLYLILVSFLCGVLLLGASVYTLSRNGTALKPFHQKIEKIPLD